MKIKWSPSGYYGTLQKGWNLTTFLITSKFLVYCSGNFLGRKRSLIEAQTLAQDWVNENVE